MVGLVIVSHSRALSAALADLVRRVARQDLPLAAVGGSGEDHTDFGTDAVDIAAAIQSVCQPEGVVVLMDLGSAVLSAETALEFLDDAMRTKVRLCSAPLVEGAVAAAVQIGLGSDLETVCREAGLGLVPKKRHLDASGDQPLTVSPPSPHGRGRRRWQEIRLTVKTPHGLHARPAARLVQAAGNFHAQVRIRKAGSGQPPVAADSLNRIALLDVARGDEIVVAAVGPEAEKALAAVRDIVENPGKDTGGNVPTAISLPSEIAGERRGVKALAVSPGVAVGPLFTYRPPAPQVPAHRISDPEREWKRLQRALALVDREVVAQYNRALRQLGADEAAIFEAHRLMLKDPDLLDRAHRAIFEQKRNAALAWQRSVAAVAAGYEGLCDDYLRQRAADLLDTGRQVLLALAGRSPGRRVDMPAASILVARDLAPADLTAISPDRLLGLVTVAGSPTSHSAILARSLGVPALAGAPASIVQLPPGTPLGLDGFNGRLWVDPPADLIEDLRQKRRRWLAQRRERRRAARQPAATTDGRRVCVAANAGSIAEARAAAENGAEGIGLLRTEFIYLSCTEPPAEEAQRTTLREIASLMSDATVCVRTLDAGGDKPLSGLQPAPETNPFLGVRGVRLSLSRPDLLHVQLRAVLRAAADGPLRLMFPMISTVEEVERCLAALEAVHHQLEDEDMEHGWPLPVGIMIETPSAALLMPELAGRLDFFSVGTNDLVQYTLAAERGNPALAAYADALHPAVLRLVRQVVECAHDRGKPVSVCGELAADTAAVPVLIGLGVDELSVAPAAVADVKALIRRLDSRRCRHLAAEALACDRATAVRRRAQAFLAKLSSSPDVDKNNGLV